MASKNICWIAACHQVSDAREWHLVSVSGRLVWRYGNLEQETLIGHLRALTAQTGLGSGRPRWACPLCAHGQVMSVHHSGVSWCLWLQRSQGGHHIARGEAGRRRGCSRQRGQPLQKLRREHKAASWGPQPRGRKAGIDPPAWGGRFKGGRALHGLRSVLIGFQCPV